MIMVPELQLIPILRLKLSYAWLCDDGHHAPQTSVYNFQRK